MKSHTAWLIVLLLALSLTVGGLAQDVEPTEERYAGRPEAAAPPFPADLDWVNVDGELTLDDLRGKVVLLDFWTYGCINCIHMIPILEQLEQKYADELVIIGVHSAKFENEGQTANIEQIVQRYEVKHPIINDSEFRVWNTYRIFGVNAWPTFALIDPRGNVYAVQPGEVPFEAFDNVIGNMITYFDTQGELNRDPLPNLDPELATAPPRALNYPGKVLADSEGNRLFIADSVNHRIVIAALDTYEVLDVIGSGAQGYSDGDFDTAQFYKPQGMALRDNTLYVADTFNHTIRAVDLNTASVTTIAGTGVKGRTFISEPVFSALGVDLRSPWALTFGADPDTLYVAMAGTHQIWAFDLGSGEMRFAVGNGREAQLNDRLLTSELAQPSGLHFEDGKLYFADSESSTIRVADIEADSVAVVSGTTDNSLFDYGDIDGALGENRLQHPLGVVGDGSGAIYFADTYNSKIKVIDTELNTITLFGGDVPGFADGDGETALLNEPGGLDYADGKLYVADTNNHAIRVIDLASETMTTVSFPNPEALQIDGQATVVAGNEFAGADVLAAQQIAAGDAEIVLSLALPEGYKINDLAPSQAAFTVSEGIAIEGDTYTIETTELRVPVTVEAGDATVFGAFDVYYCEAVNETLCFIEQFAVELPVTVGAGDADVITIEREITPPETEATGSV